MVRVNGTVIRGEWSFDDKKVPIVESRQHVTADN